MTFKVRESISLLKKVKYLGKIGGSHDFQSKWINSIASKFMAKILGKIGASHDFQSKWINFIASKFMAKLNRGY